MSEKNTSLKAKLSIFQALSLSLSLSLSLGWWLGFWGCVWMRGLRVGGVFWENWFGSVFGNGGILFCMKKSLPRKICGKRGIWFTAVTVYACGLVCGPLYLILGTKDMGHRYLVHHEPVLRLTGDYGFEFWFF